MSTLNTEMKGLTDQKRGNTLYSATKPPGFSGVHVTRSLFALHDIPGGNYYNSVLSSVLSKDESFPLISGTIWKQNMSSLVQTARREFEDPKGVLIIRISKKNRQHNDQKKKSNSYITIYSPFLCLTIRLTAMVHKPGQIPFRTSINNSKNKISFICCASSLQNFCGHHHKLINHYDISNEYFPITYIFSFLYH
jgi:hypothetical protein